MTIFSSLKAARAAGFHWYDYSASEQLHVVVAERRACSGRRVRSLAFARPAEDDMAHVELVRGMPSN